MAYSSRTRTMASRLSSSPCKKESTSALSSSSSSSRMKSCSLLRMWQMVMRSMVRISRQESRCCRHTLDWSVLRSRSFSRICLTLLGSAIRIMSSSFALTRSVALSPTVSDPSVPACIIPSFHNRAQFRNKYVDKLTLCDQRVDVLFDESTGLVGVRGDEVAAVGVEGQEGAVPEAPREEGVPKRVVVGLVAAVGGHHPGDDPELGLVEHADALPAFEVDPQVPVEEGLGGREDLHVGDAAAVPELDAGVPVAVGEVHDVVQSRRCGGCVAEGG
eukprot:764201-Hanusia_phi.AAC.2